MTLTRVTSVPATTIISAETVVALALDEELTTRTSKVGDRFRVVLHDDIAVDGQTILPKGVAGHGEVTFVSRRGAFGKPGFLEIVVRALQFGDLIIPLTGRYREEGKGKGDEAAATMFMVGLASAFVKGKIATIPKGRVLRARLSADVAIPNTSQNPGRPSADAISQSSSAPHSLQQQ